ncbi:MAG: hypothetical protein ACAI35_12075 [Candidatus Methylacidiphilales bacterium]
MEKTVAVELEDELELLAVEAALRGIPLNAVMVEIIQHKLDHGLLPPCSPPKPPT